MQILVGMRLLGPAYLAALERMLIAERDSTSDSHPPHFIRRINCRKYLTVSYMPHISDDSIWHQLLISDQIKEKAFSEVDYEMARDTVDNALLDLIDLSKKLPSFLDEDAAKISAMVGDIEDHLFHLSPPSSIMADVNGNTQDAAGFWKILYSAWHFRLDERRFKDFIDRYGWDFDRGEEVLSNLVVHSLKSLEIRSHFKRWCKCEKGANNGSKS